MKIPIFSHVFNIYDVPSIIFLLRLKKIQNLSFDEAKSIIERDFIGKKTVNNCIFFFSDEGCLDCRYLHLGSCFHESLNIGKKMIKANYKFYVPFHFVPLIISRKIFKFYKKYVFILQKKKEFQIYKFSPWILITAFINYLRSLLFVGSFLAITSRVFCYLVKKRNKYDCKKKNLKIFKIAIFLTFCYKKDLTLCLPSFLSGFTLYLEAKGRRGEIMLYVMSSFYECLWNFLRKRHLVFDIPKGEV